jgi:hypothetical protein
MSAMTTVHENRARAVDVIDVSRSDDVTLSWVQFILSWVGAAALVLLIPLVLLAIGMPLVFGVRALFDLVARLLGQ